MSRQISNRLPGTPATSPLRALLFYAGLVAAGVALVARMFTMQVLERAGYAAQAFENRISRVNDPAPRGIIYDRRLVPLAVNVPSFGVTITPASLPENPAQVDRIYDRLAELLNLPITVPGSTPKAPCSPGRGLRDLVEEGAGFRPFTPVKVGCDVSKELALVIREAVADMPGVSVVTEPLRSYPTGALTAHLVGYMARIPDPNESDYFRRLYDYYVDRGLVPDRDRIGVIGVEAAEQDRLAGQNGSALVEKDVAGQTIRRVDVETETVPGQNLQLTIDVRLQQAAESALTGRITFVNEYLAQLKSTSGVAIAMNPMNGDVLAMVSWPTFDNNRFARQIDYDYYETLSNTVDSPMTNKAVSGIYPPGSVFKMVTATGVLEENVIDPREKLEDEGKIVIRNRYFPTDPGKAQTFVCWKSDGHGEVDFIRGVAESCDVYFYKIGGGWEPEGVQGLGIERLARWMEIFGFGRPSGIQLAGEAAGFIPDSVWKRRRYGENWATGDTYNASMGQGYVLSTPLQMLNAINAIINGGTLYQPNLVHRILDGEGNVMAEPEPVVNATVPIRPENVQLLHQGMREAVLTGTLAGAIEVFAGEENTPIVDVPGINVAGKTGTAEYCDRIAWDKNLCQPGRWPTHAWTALYAPYENPEISVIVFVYNGGEGSKMAGPIANQILRTYFQLKEADAASGAGQP